MNNLAKTSASLTNVAKRVFGFFLRREGGGTLLLESGDRIILTSSIKTPLTNQAKHGV
jgi:hypothetical protein